METEIKFKKDTYIPAREARELTFSSTNVKKFLDQCYKQIVGSCRAAEDSTKVYLQGATVNELYVVKRELKANGYRVDSNNSERQIIYIEW